MQTQLVVALAFGVLGDAPFDRVGGIAGTIIDDGGDPVGYAIVVAESADGQVARSTAADSGGRFSIADLLPGRYHLSATAEGRRPATAAVEVRDWDEAHASLVLEPLPTPRRRGGATGGCALEGVPLPVRTAAALARLSPRWRTSHADTFRFGTEWLVSGFEATHPRTGNLAIPLRLSGMGTLNVIGGDSTGRQVWGGGRLVAATLCSGSNRHEASAMGALTELAAGGAFDGWVSGPLWKDRAWFSTSVSLADEDRPWRSEGQILTLATALTLQASSRHELRMLTAAAATGEKRRGLAGLGWSALLSDNLILDSQISTFSETPIDDARMVGRLEDLRARADVELFLSRFDFSFRVAGGRLHERHGELRGATSLGAGARIGRWLRADLTFGAGVRAGEQGSWGAGVLTWDATRDGRTAIRTRASRSAAPGTAAVDELSAGIERDTWEELAISAELASRRVVSGSGAVTEEILALQASRRSGAFRLSATYRQGLSRWAAGEIAALLGFPTWSGGSLGMLILRAPTGTWLPILAEDPEALVTAQNTPAGWLAGVQLRTELGAWLPWASALWIDVLESAPRSGADRTSALGRVLRAGLRVDL